MLAISAIINRYFTNYTGLSKICWVGIFLFFIEAALGGICFFLSIYFVEVLHINIAMSGIILSFYGLGTILGGLLGGKLSDRLSPASISIWSLLLEALSFTTLLKVSTPNLLILSMFILGVASYGFLTSNNLWVLNQCKNNEKLKVINILTAASNLGIGVSALIVSLSSCYGLKYYIALDSILLFISAIYFYFLHKRYVNKNRIQLFQQKIPKIESKIFKKNKSLLKLIVVCLFLIGLIVAQLSSTCSIYIKDLFPEYGINCISFLFAINSILIILLQTPMVNFFANGNKLLVVGVGAFLIGFSMFMLVFSFSFVLVILARIIFTVGEMLFFSIAQLVCYEHGLQEEKGKSLGIYRTTYAASVVMGPTLGGYAYMYLGSDVLWYISGLLGALCLLLCYRYKNMVNC